ncbi:hypothetical protein GQ53DRAFT_758795 [Thozetella sp. PMI_491]|nr:hypothetical protein GQ53DRAFT_758795 [Thozetella sp. PMI_491]
MFESWYDRHEDKTRFWLEFQVCSDGFDDADARLTGRDPAAPHTAGPETFSCFGDLPPELRLQIWEAAIQPRVVLAACFNSHHQDAKRAQLAARARKRRVPVLLHVCHESRQLALRHYELAFSWKIPHRLASSESGPDQCAAGLWFNFELDALLFLGELEPFDSYGFNSPMVYFLRKEDTRRVRHVACAFEELHLGIYESEQIFGSLFHLLDRFPAVKRLLITTTPKDQEVSHLMLPTADNVIQKLWWAWINGTSVVTSSLANKQILMIREDDIASFITDRI